MGCVAMVTSDCGDRVPILRQYVPHRTVERAVSMRVRLIRKLADQLDGVDVSGHSEGDVLELTRRDAELLIAERWAVRLEEPAQSKRRHMFGSVDCAMAADARCPEPRRDRRRADDRVRDELDDRHARPPKRDE